MNKKYELTKALGQAFNSLLEPKKELIGLILIFTVFSSLLNFSLSIYLTNKLITTFELQIIAIISLLLSLFLYFYYGSCFISFLYKPKQDLVKILKSGFLILPKFLLISFINFLIIVSPFLILFLFSLLTQNLIIITFLLIFSLIVSLVISIKLSISPYIYVINKKDIASSISLSMKSIRGINILKVFVGNLLITLVFLFLLFPIYLLTFISNVFEVLIFLVSIVNQYIFISFFYNSYKLLYKSK
ncbi:MAG: hypothetical protein QXQ14_01780 [Candidatus Aenigmatarchaeota archaeon]